MRAGPRVGVLVPVVFDWYFAQILHGIADAVYEHRLRLMLWPTRHEHAREVALLNELREATDGAVLVLPEQSSDELLAAFSDRYPLVVVDPLVRIDPRIPSVAAANASGAEQAMQHLLELGTGGSQRSPDRRGGWRRRSDDRRTAAPSQRGIAFDPTLELEADFDFEPVLRRCGAARARPAADRDLRVQRHDRDRRDEGSALARHHDPGQAVDRRVRRQPYATVVHLR